MLPLCYQLCYYRIQDEVGSRSHKFAVIVPFKHTKGWIWLVLCPFLSQECSIQNISLGSTSLTILQTSLEPSQYYQVKVRSLLFPEECSEYRGIPSRWSDPVGWTSDEGNCLNQQKHTRASHPDFSHFHGNYFLLFFVLAQRYTTWATVGDNQHGIIYSVLCSDSHLVGCHSDVSGHRCICDHSLLRTVLHHSCLSKVLYLFVCDVLNVKHELSLLIKYLFSLGRHFSAFHPKSCVLNR